MYVDLSNNPVQLHLMGYDFIFGYRTDFYFFIYLFSSHPDEYVFNYDVYVPGAIDPKVFTEPAICQNPKAATFRRSKYHRNFTDFSLAMRAKQLMGLLGVFNPDPSEIAEPFEQFYHKVNIEPSIRAKNSSSTTSTTPVKKKRKPEDKSS